MRRTYILAENFARYSINAGALKDIYFVAAKLIDKGGRGGGGVETDLAGYFPVFQVILEFYKLYCLLFDGTI